MTENLLDGGEDLPIIDQNKDYLAELVGEGKKFKDQKELAKGKYEADQYIETLKKQQDELRADYLKLREESAATAKLEELISQLDSRQKPNGNENTQVPDVNKPVVDPKAIESLVSSKIEEYNQTKKQETNYNQVKTKLIERFGNNYQNALKEQIDELGLTVEDINTLARKSPAAFFRTLGLDQPVQTDTFQSPPRSTQRSDSFSPKGSPKRTWSWYQDLRRTNPTAYYDPKTTIQRHKDYEELGPAFEDGDFKSLG